MDQLREFFWSARVAQWAPVAGLIAVLRVRRGAVAALLAGWLAAFLVVKGFSPRATIESGSFWRLLMPAWPAYLLLSRRFPCSCRLLRGSRRAPARAVVFSGRSPLDRARRRLTLLVPAAAIAVSSPLEGPELALTQDDAGNFILTSVDESVDLQGGARPDGNRLTWDDGPWRANVFYRVYRAEGEDVECENTDGHPAQSCYVRGARSRPFASASSSTRTPRPARPTASGSARTGSTTRRSGTSSRSVRRPFRPAELLLEQGDPLREIDVLVGQPRDHRRVVEEHEEDEERRDREEHAGG